jgi:serine protease Do
MMIQTAQKAQITRHFYRGFWVFARVALMLAFLISAAACQMGSTSSAAELVTATAAPASAEPTASAAPTSASATDFSTVIRDVAQQVKPAVVQITNEQVQIDRFNQSLTVPAGVGSGVIYDTQGHILANNHVIADAQQLVVALPDGRAFPAKLIGADPQTDLAVVQIAAVISPWPNSATRMRCKWAIGWSRSAMR